MANAMELCVKYQSGPYEVRPTLCFKWFERSRISFEAGPVGLSGDFFDLVDLNLKMRFIPAFCDGPTNPLLK